MNLVIAGDSDGLGSALAARAASAGLSVRLASGRGSGTEEREGVEVLRCGRAAAIADSAGWGEVVVLLASSATVPVRAAEIEASLANAEAGWRRLVLWGPHRVYPPGVVRPLRPALEEDPLVDAGRWADAARLDRDLAAGTISERFVFRAAPVVGLAADDWLAAVGSAPLIPSRRVDVPLQLLHHEDAVEILWRAVRSGHPGVYNAAGDGLLFVRRVARRLGRVALPLPRLLGASLLLPGRLLGRPTSIQAVLESAYDPIVIDNGRLKTHFGYRPRRSAATALASALPESADG